MSLKGSSSSNIEGLGPLLKGHRFSQRENLELSNSQQLSGRDGTLVSNLCEYFVSIHGQHKIRGIRDASSLGSCRSSLI